jgi:hypothetical protein
MMGREKAFFLSVLHPVTTDVESAAAPTTAVVGTATALVASSPQASSMLTLPVHPLEIGKNYDRRYQSQQQIFCHCQKERNSTA